MVLLFFCCNSSIYAMFKIEGNNKFTIELHRTVFLRQQIWKTVTVQFYNKQLIVKPELLPDNNHMLYFYVHFARKTILQKKNRSYPFHENQLDMSNLSHVQFLSLLSKYFLKFFMAANFYLIWHIVFQSVVGSSFLQFKKTKCLRKFFKIFTLKRKVRLNNYFEKCYRTSNMMTCR